MNALEEKQILTEARERISDEENWRTGQAWDSKGRYCAIGAVGMCFVERGLIPEDENYLYRDEPEAIDDIQYPHSVDIFPIFKRLIKAVDRESALIEPEVESVSCVGVFNYNDSHEHAEVLAMFDRAIEECV